MIFDVTPELERDLKLFMKRKGLVGASFPRRVDEDENVLLERRYHRFLKACVRYGAS